MIFVLICLLVAPVSAYAYVDPNAGGGWFQLLTPIFAALATAWVFLRNGLKRLVSKTAAKPGQ